MQMQGKDWLSTALVLLAATLLTFVLQLAGVERENFLMVYMVGVLVCAAITHGYRYSIVQALGSVLLFNYFYTQPLRTFTISNSNDVTMLVFFLIAAVVSAGMTARFLQALRQSKENEQRAEALFKEKEGARLEAEQAKLRGDLLRSIGHDLRTPLTGIQVGSNYLMEHSATLPRAEIKKMAEELGEQTTWLITLVENILYMTRLDNKKLAVNKQPEVVDDVISEAVARLPALHDRPLKIQLPEQVEMVPMDGKMIVQVLINLLDNALKYTPAHCPITLGAARRGDEMCFTVEDGGAGVPPDQAEAIWGSFVTSGKVGADGRKGMGLGLAICQAAVQAHGGTVRVDRSPALGGARFLFTLPMEPADGGKSDG